MNIVDFYKLHTIDPDFDYYFYQTQYPETIGYYQPFCLEHNISEEQRLYYHYILFGQSFGYAKNLSEFIKHSVVGVDLSQIHTHDIEKICPISANYLDSYSIQTQNGKNIASRSSIGILSLARNCAKNLSKSLASIQKLECKDWYMLIYENDSTDDTKDILRSIDDNHITITHNDEGSPYLTDRSSSRTNNLAKYRNVCLDWLKKNYSHCEYVIVLDLDADLGFSVDGIYNSIGWLNILSNAGGMGSYSIYLSINKHKIVFAHYDSFATRFNDWEPTINNIDINNAWFRHWHPVIGSNPAPLYSCFGGLAVYKTKALLKGRYSGELGSEHISLHKDLYNHGYNMYLNSSSRFFAINNIVQES
jgi:hypothetical protein